MSATRIFPGEPRYKEGDTIYCVHCGKSAIVMLTAGTWRTSYTDNKIGSAVCSSCGAAFMFTDKRESDVIAVYEEEL